jgi:hypothetical protein
MLKEILNLGRKKEEIDGQVRMLAYITRDLVSRACSLVSQAW